MLENSERTQREEKLSIVIIQLCPLPYREQMKPLLTIALTMLTDDSMEELEKDMIGIPEEVAEGKLDRLIAVGQKFGVNSDITSSPMLQAMLPKDAPG
jgi:hypothetical protein